MPVIGNGDMASVLVDRPDRLYFVSGVSNSAEDRESEYQRELNLLLSQNRSMHVVYVSSLAVFYSNTRYAQHKREMERAVKAYFPKYTIIRIGNITWGDNPHTLLNFIRGQIQRGEEPFIQDVYRYVVDEEEFSYWIEQIPDWSCEMNVPGQRLKVADIVEKWCR